MPIAGWDGWRASRGFEPQCAYASATTVVRVRVRVSVREGEGEGEGSSRGVLTFLPVELLSSG